MRRNAHFDHRLVLSGYPQLLLVLAKLTSLLIGAAFISFYTTFILYAFWCPDSLMLVWFAFFCSALSYGALGMLLGVLVRGELEGFFLIIMISLIDTAMQNPFGNPMANQDFLAWFPTYAPMQLCVAGAFAQRLPWHYVSISLAWPLGFSLIGLAIFWWKTSAWDVHTTIG